MDVRKYHPGASTFKSEIDTDFLITYMGRVDPEKNVDDLLKVFVELRVPPTHRLAVGN